MSHGLPNLQRRRGMTLLAGLALPVGVGVAADTPLRIGVVPFLSPAALLQSFRPMREHLERSLARPVEMTTAKDFGALIEAAQRGEFDVALLPAHIAALALSDWRFVPLAGTADSVTVEVYVRDARFQKPSDLRGAKVGMLDALALTATVGRQWLQEQRLLDSVSIVALPSINSALIALDRGEVEAVVAGKSQLMTLPADTPRGERVLASLTDIPGPIYVAHPRLAPTEAERVRLALWAYRPDSSRPPVTSNAVLQPVTTERLRQIESYVALARRALTQRP